MGAIGLVGGIGLLFIGQVDALIFATASGSLIFSILVLSTGRALAPRLAPCTSEEDSVYEERLDAELAGKEPRLPRARLRKR